MEQTFIVTVIIFCIQHFLCIIVVITICYLQITNIPSNENSASGSCKILLWREVNICRQTSKRNDKYITCCTLCEFNGKEGGTLCVWKVIYKFRRLCILSGLSSVWGGLCRSLGTSSPWPSALWRRWRARAPEAPPAGWPPPQGSGPRSGEWASRRGRGPWQCQDLGTGILFVLRKVDRRRQKKKEDGNHFMFM